MKCTYPPVPMVETFARFPIRMWTIPADDYIAFPTPFFYRFRTVVFTNEGNTSFPRWVALDRYNDDDWYKSKFTKGESGDNLAALYDEVISSDEGFNLRYEPKVVLPPPLPGISPLELVMASLTRFLSKLAGG